ncbi:MAG: hypothetical protein R3186_09915, partial [Ruegeria sp.]|nr:hypothetical protein [Ruegeria sp.]
WANAQDVSLDLALYGNLAFRVAGEGHHRWTYPLQRSRRGGPEHAVPCRLDLCPPHSDREDRSGYVVNAEWTPMSDACDIPPSIENTKTATLVHLKVTSRMRDGFLFAVSKRNGR